MAGRTPFLMQAKIADGIIISGDEPPRCENCIYFSPRPTDSGVYGDCRRNTPDAQFGFPGVEKTDFCGSWDSGEEF